jgi:CPA2 family monovalent cation:H+ antiporter-2
MIHDMQYLFVVIMLLLTAVIIIATCRSLKISPVLGYFVAGAAIGKYGFALIVPGKGIELFGEIGIVFLLFVIGLELTIDRLMSMRKHVFGFGGLQVILTSILITLIFFYVFKLDLKPSIILGGGLALSSTAIVLQVLDERSMRSSRVGRLSIAVLLMQDFAVVPLLVLLPILSKGSSVSPTLEIIDGASNFLQANNSGGGKEIIFALGVAFGKAILALLTIFVIGRVFLKPFFRIIASIKSNELFLSATLLIVLGAAYITDMLELSMALGAFIAGLMVAETEYAHEVEDAIIPFKSLLLGLFFMTVGMSIDFKLLISHIEQILLYSAIIVIIKGGIIFLLCKLFKFGNRKAIQAGLLLCQGSEFAFILFRLAGESGLMQPSFAQIMLMVTTLTMALTPLFAILGEYIISKSEEGDLLDSKNYISTEVSDIHDHVIIVGFGNTGKVLANILISQYVYYVAIDINPQIVKSERGNGYLVYRGDGTKIDIFEEVGIKRASNLVIAVPNMITAKKIATVVKAKYPELKIIAKSYDMEDISGLNKSGIDEIVPENYEVSIMLASGVLESLSFSDQEIESMQYRLRNARYKLIRQDFVEEEGI